MWKLQFVKIVSVVISVKGIPNRTLIQSMKILELLDGFIITKQRAVTFQTCQILPKFVTVEGEMNFSSVLVILATKMLCIFMKTG